MDEEQRFDAMQSLAMVRYAPAVKDAEEFLKVDSDRYYWQVYFIFGLFDDLADPMLCEETNENCCAYPFWFDLRYVADFAVCRPICLGCSFVNPGEWCHIDCGDEKVI